MAWIYAQRKHEATASVNPQGEEYHRKGPAAGVYTLEKGTEHQAITTIVEREMDNRLKVYLAA